MVCEPHVCPVCQNKDPIYIAYKNQKPYCRKCIALIKGEKALNRSFEHLTPIHAKLKYPLTLTQQKASHEILNYVKNHQSVIVNAVCGAGKTELVYRSIEYAINQNQKVAFAIPRKDICIEIYNRLKSDYPTLDMCLVYGGHHDALSAQLVVLTTHQLFRYEHYFDLLILDEADAFPYYQNELLNTFLKKSVTGSIIYLSATLRKDDLKKCKNIVYVNRRFHQKDLPIPKIIRCFSFNKIKVLNQIIKQLIPLPILIFVPTIDCGQKLSAILKIPFIYAAFKDKEKYIQKFQKKEIKILITTSILERGMTFENVQVIVFDANHDLYDQSSLIQISGRVGRKLNYPTGKVYFLATRQSLAMRVCIREIIRKNKAIV